MRSRGPHLWEINAVRDLLALFFLVGTLWLLVKLQAVTVPVIVGFVLAYLADPLLRLGKRFGISRGLSVVFSLCFLMLTTVGFFLLVVPRIVVEVQKLTTRMPRYLDILENDYQIKIPELSEAIRDASANLDKLEPWATYLRPVLSWISAILGLTSYSIVAAMLTLSVFAFAAWHFENIPDLTHWIPRSRRKSLSITFGKIQVVFAGFFRGQMIVAIFTTLVFGLGFFIVGVPYWFLAALIGGFFSVIPYGQASGWVLAVGFSFIDAQAHAGGEPVDWGMLVLAPSIVYLFMQITETFVLTPLIQGTSTRMHPIAVLAAIIGGGSLGGIAGVFLAIPVAASMKVVVEDIIIPGWEAWADDH